MESGWTAMALVVLGLFNSLDLQTATAAALSDQKPMDYTTLKDQRHLVRLEQNLISNLVNYTRAAELALFEIQRYLTRYSATVLDPLLRDGKISLGQGWNLGAFEAMTEVAEHMVKNPLMGLQTLLRIDDEFRELERALDYHEASLDNLELFLKGHREEVQLPEMKNVEEQRDSLLNLWHMYDWTFDDVRSGRLASVETGTGLDAGDLLDIGHDMFQRNLLSEAIHVIGNGKKLLGPYENVDFVRAVDETLAAAVEKHDRIHHILTSPEKNTQNPYFFPEKIGKLEPKHLQWPTRQKLASDSDEPPSMDDPSFPMYVSVTSYPKLCRGERPRTEEILKCFLVSHHHPYWTLQPQKFEVLSKDPFVIQVHDVISESFIEKFKSSRLSQLYRSFIVNEYGGDENSDARISSTLTLSQEEAEGWNRVAELTTGLSVASDIENEPLQVTNYAPGGHFSPHMDALYSIESVRVAFEEERGDDRGDRLMTFMFYLSSMEGGGRTAFPILKTFAEPVKGSALMWYNLHPNTTTDFRMAHGGCPVVLGTKWVATKWIRARAQALRSQCAPQRDFEQEKYWFHDSFGLPRN